MAKYIISFVPRHRREEAKTIRRNRLVQAAWKFAHCALWTEQTISVIDEETVTQYIAEYLSAATDQKRAFRALVQRVILTRNYIQSAPFRYVPSPSVWFNPNYPFGFAGTLAWLKKIEQMRVEVPGYLAHLEVFAKQYYYYAAHPSDHNISRCREALLDHNADSLLQLFYTTIIHLNFLRA